MVAGFWVLACWSESIKSDEMEIGTLAQWQSCALARELQRRGSLATTIRSLRTRSSIPWPFSQAAFLLTCAVHFESANSGTRCLTTLCTGEIDTNITEVYNAE